MKENEHDSRSRWRRADATQERKAAVCRYALLFAIRGRISDGNDSSHPVRLIPQFLQGTDGRRLTIRRSQEFRPRCERRETVGEFRAGEPLLPYSGAADAGAGIAGGPDSRLRQDPSHRHSPYAVVPPICGARCDCGIDVGIHLRSAQWPDRSVFPNVRSAGAEPAVRRRHAVFHLQYCTVVLYGI